MYKRSSPEALTIASLGRADSKIPDKTCRGITVAGKACRKPIKKGSRDKYCHLHLDQQATSRSRLLGAKGATTIAVLEQDDEEVYVDQRRQQSAKVRPRDQYPTPSSSPTPSPSTPKRNTPVRKPVPSLAFPPEQRFRTPSLQLSPPASIPPPTPPTSPHSVKSPPSSPSPIRPNKSGISKLGKAFQRLFLAGTKKSHPSSTTYTYPASLGPAFKRNDLPLSRYPRTITPTGLPGSSKPLKPVSATDQSPSNAQPSKPVKAPALQQRPPTSILALAQSRTAIIDGVQRSWETLWVPGIDGCGAHIICKGFHPSQSSLMHRMVKSLSVGSWEAETADLYACSP